MYVFNPEKARAKILNTPPGRHAIYIYIYIYHTTLNDKLTIIFKQKKLTFFSLIMLCNHANLNIHIIHSTNIDRKTL